MTNQHERLTNAAGIPIPSNEVSKSVGDRVSKTMADLEPPKPQPSPGSV